VAVAGEALGEGAEVLVGRVIDLGWMRVDDPLQLQPLLALERLHREVEGARGGPARGAGARRRVREEARDDRPQAGAEERAAALGRVGGDLALDLAEDPVAEDEQATALSEDGQVNLGQAGALVLRHGVAQVDAATGIDEHLPGPLPGLRVALRAAVAEEELEAIEDGVGHGGTSSS
jgi:hypothetical protein